MSDYYPDEEWMRALDGPENRIAVSEAHEARCEQARSTGHDYTTRDRMRAPVSRVEMRERFEQFG
jgi:hypothetical protein